MEKKKEIPISYKEIGYLLEKFAVPLGGSCIIIDDQKKVRYVTRLSPLCNILRKQDANMCSKFLEENFSKARETSKPFTTKCPIGKLVYVVPIYINETFIGMGTGSVGVASFSRRRRRKLIEIARNANIPEGKLLKLAEEEFLNKRYLMTNNRDIFFREIKNTECVMKTLNRFLEVLKIRIAMKKIKPHCAYAYDLMDSLEYLAAGNFSPSPENFGKNSERDLMLKLVELAKKTCRDILKVTLSESIRWKAYHDSLTGVYNRYVLEEELKKIRELRLAPVAFILVDMDDLKKINDRYGHEMGDKAIYAVARAVKSAVRKNDVVVRMGGDEFIIVLPGITEKEVKEVVERIEENVTRSASIFGLPFNLSVSIGYEILKAYEDPEEAILRADKNMYRCKRCRKNGEKEN
ncbi:diguanylate cyclase domain-containing protein [Desulfurobacterium sp.]